MDAPRLPVQKPLTMLCDSSESALVSELSEGEGSVRDVESVMMFVAVEGSTGRGEEGRGVGMLS